MQLVIDVPKKVYEALKGIAEDTTNLDPYSLADIIVNKSKPYEERPHDKWIISEIRCPYCLEYFDADCFSKEELNKCPNCGKDMRKGAEIETP